MTSKTFYSQQLGSHQVELDPTVDSLSRFGSRVRALVWPTRTLVGSQRWFDELYVWTADFEPDRSLRSQIQLAAMEHAFSMLEHERVERVAVTVSFGSVERSLEAFANVLEAHRYTAHRLSVLLRGAMERLRWPYRVREFIETHVRSRSGDYKSQIAEGDRWQPVPVIEELKPLAREAGLWNLFMPPGSALRHVDESFEFEGTQLTNLEYALCAEEMGRIMWSAEVFNCSAPATGNMSVLHRYGTREQKESG